MKLLNGIINSPELPAALSGLMKREISVKQCVELSSMVEMLNMQKSIIERTRMTIIEKHAMKKDDDNIVLQEDGRTPAFPDEEAQIRCQEEVKELMAESFDIPLSSKIPVKEDDKMTLQDYNVLKDIIIIS